MSPTAVLYLIYTKTSKHGCDLEPFKYSLLIFVEGKVPSVLRLTKFSIRFFGLKTVHQVIAVFLALTVYRISVSSSFGIFENNLISTAPPAPILLILPEKEIASS